MKAGTKAAETNTEHKYGAGGTRESEREKWRKHTWRKSSERTETTVGERGKIGAFHGH